MLLGVCLNSERINKELNKELVYMTERVRNVKRTIKAERREGQRQSVKERAIYIRKDERKGENPALFSLCALSGPRSLLPHKH